MEANYCSVTMVENLTTIDLMSYTYFISDLHLNAEHPELTEKFLQFLKTDALQADALYILGDFFEYWIGDDAQQPHHDKIFQALQLARQNGLPIYFMYGNRDFLVSQKLLKQYGIIFLPDPTVIDLYGKNALLMHGDLLCTNDVAYQRYRKCIYNPILQTIFLMLPLFLRQKAAKYMRGRSGQPSKPIESYLASEETAQKYLRQAETDLLIHGHTHRPKIHKHEHHTRVVLGAWENDGEILKYNENGTYKLIVSGE